MSDDGQSFNSVVNFKRQRIVLNTLSCMTFNEQLNYCKLAHACYGRSYRYIAIRNWPIAGRSMALLLRDAPVILICLKSLTCEESPARVSFVRS